MKKLLLLSLILLSFLSVFGCSAKKQVLSADNSGSDSAEVRETTPAEPDETCSSTSTEEWNEHVPEPTAEEATLSNESIVPPVEEDARRLAFGKVLWDVYQRGILPSGKRLEYQCYYSMEAAVKNNFAVTDVDGDGQDELLILWETATMSGLTGCVFGYDGGEVYQELLALTSLRFYDNGIVEEDASHNQNLAGEFWPYSVHQYDAERGIYQSLGGVDAWDRRVREENGENSIWPAHFPTDIDVDGDGIIYFILPADWDGYYHDVPMVDSVDYENWRNAYLGGAKDLDIPFQKITEENISALGYPKPNVQYPQPAG